MWEGRQTVAGLVCDHKPVKLVSDDGACLDIRPVGYQFTTSPQAVIGTDWDANWLVIRADVRTAQGRQWTFLSPCLTTWEARALTSWLRGVAVGEIVPAPEPSEDDGVEHFTEPNIAFSLEHRGDVASRIRVHFSLEALPPWVLRRQGRELYRYFLVFEVSHEALARAVDDWDRDCDPFPAR
jgi:hypothetical protein